jgi:carbohydrate kinase (thermoresistant glucokinase family)
MSKPPPPPLVLVVMGVSGSGKTTVAAMLAGRLGWRFAEGDDFHPAANVAKMRSGTPLDDADRWPWLEAIAAQIDRWRAQRQRGVITCSALKRRYRAVIIGARDDVRLVYLDGSPELIAQRLASRTGHFFPPALLQSQFADLEPPLSEENAITVSVGDPPAVIVDRIVAVLTPR